MPKILSHRTGDLAGQKLVAVLMADPDGERRVRNGKVGGCRERMDYPTAELLRGAGVALQNAPDKVGIK